MGSDGVDESVDGEDYGVPNVSLDQHHAQRHSKLSVTDLETSDDLAQKLYALREEHAVLQKESLIRQRLLQRSEAEADSLKREMEGLQIALMDLREENRVGALEYQRLRNAHMEDMERLKRMVTEPRKRFAEMEALVEVSEMEKREVGERLREAEGEVEELRRMLGDAREMIEKQGEGEIGTFVRSVMGRAMMCSVAVQTGPFDFVGTLEKGMARKVTFSLPGTPVEGEVGDEEKSLLMTFGGEAMDSVTRESGDGEDVKRISTASDVEPVVLQEAPLSPTSQLIGSRSVPNGDISTIVRLMVGAWLLKYNKRRSKAERRFVMVNPYTRTISWSKRDPSDEKNDGVSTVYIQSVHVEDLTDGRSRIVIIAPTREVVFECRSAAEHGIWERGLTLILQNHRGAIQRTTR
ncbi:meiotic cell cortex C-terminal pleckstrin homology-domain-containing protein [Chytridium lagenaria]|nr:meiotic cell cortex C-terminal pleckstrin homology-domain-containing protein [Chytridium lagenaria]